MYTISFNSWFLQYKFYTWHWITCSYCHEHQPNMHVRPFTDPTHHVYQPTKRVCVHFIMSLSMTRSNTQLRFKNHLKNMIWELVPRVIVDYVWLQCWTHNHILPISCPWEHHIESLKRAKVVLISKLCFVTHIWPLDNMKFVSKMIKIVSKWWKFIHRSCVWDAYTG